MRKLTLVNILLPLLFLGCNKSIYYAYETPKSYCVFEVTSRNDVVYRATSENYDPAFLYLKGIGDYEESSGYKYLNIRDPFDLYFINEKAPQNMDYCSSFAFDQDSDSEVIFLYGSQEMQDSLKLFSHPSNDSLKVNYPCFQNCGLNWFPPYLKKVDNIDYSRFNLPKIKNVHLKNPERSVR